MSFQRLDDEGGQWMLLLRPSRPALPSYEASHGRIAPTDSLYKDSVMMIPRSMVAALCVLGPLTCVAHADNINGEATYISFSVPGALGTYPMSINASMEVTGYYYVSPTVERGFLREADGTITTFDVAGGNGTQPEGINAAGNITGFYYGGAGGTPRGFLRYADGRIIPLDFYPTDPLFAILPLSINDFDEVAGLWDAKFSEAFTRSGAGVMTILEPPYPYDQAAEATAINASGSVVGYSVTPGAGVGFVAHPDGYWVEIAIIPANPECVNQTIPESINAAGTIAGWYTTNYYNLPYCQPENTGGFVMSPDGEFTLFQLPGTIPPLPENGLPLISDSPDRISIDQAGDIAGSYTDAAGSQHAFVRNPYGTITSFDPPEGKQTTATTISDGGAVAGFYHYKAGGPPVGFIRVP